MARGEAGEVDEDRMLSEPAGPGDTQRAMEWHGSASCRGLCWVEMRVAEEGQGGRQGGQSGGCYRNSDGK